jgi:outer membrane protein
MKTSIKKLFLTIGAIGCFAVIPAQKTAHLSYDSLISLMPETKTATEAAQNFLKGLEQELVAMQTEMDNKYKDYLEKEPTMSDMIKKNKQEDLQQLQTRIQEFQRQAENEYKRKQAELTAPIMEKAKKGIEAVAKENGYKYVLDTSPQSTAVLYSEVSDDILGLVKKKLDTMPLANIPGVGGPGTGGIKSPPPAKSGSGNPPQKTNK